MAAALAAAGVGSYLLHLRDDGLPAPDSTTYRETARHFYRGLAALDVGLLDDAAAEFARAAELAPAEPAAWANLGLTRARQGAAGEAAGPLARAQELAPASAAIALLQGSLAGAEGRVEEGLVHLRRAVDLQPDGARARFALAAAAERAGGPDADRRAQQQLDAILLQRENLAVRIEQARLAAKRADGPALRAAAARLGALADDWPPLAAEQHGVLQEAADAGDFRRAATTLAVLRNVLVRVAAFRASLAAVQVPPELIGEPFDRFLALPAASPAAAPPDVALTFAAAPLEPGGAPPPSALLVLPPDDGGTATALAATGREAWRPGAREAALAVSGVQAAIQRLPELADRTRRAAVLGPTYGEYARVLARADIKVDHVDTLEQISEAHGLAVAVNPDNPTGRILARGDLLAAARNVAGHRGILVIDEAFADAAPAESLAGDVETHPNMIVFRSFGKFFGLAGLRLGFVIASPAIRAAFAEALGPWPVNGPALYIAPVLMQGSREAIRSKIAERRTALLNTLARAGLNGAGGTPLFAFVPAGQALALHEHLCRRRILTRRFDEWDGWLRFGLTPDGTGDARLADSLETFRETRR